MSADPQFDWMVAVAAAHEPRPYGIPTNVLEERADALRQRLLARPDGEYLIAEINSIALGERAISPVLYRRIIAYVLAGSAKEQTAAPTRARKRQGDENKARVGVMWPIARAALRAEGKSAQRKVIEGVISGWLAQEGIELSPPVVGKYRPRR